MASVLIDLGKREHRMNDLYLVYQIFGFDGHIIDLLLKFPSIFFKLSDPFYLLVQTSHLSFTQLQTQLDLFKLFFKDTQLLRSEIMFFLKLLLGLLDFKCRS